MKTIGDNLFDYVLKLKNGVCHGDFHTGNMKMVNHQLVVFDYDAVAISSPLIDYATVFDTSDFNHFEYEAFLSTTAVFSDIAKTRTELLGNHFAFTVPIERTDDWRCDHRQSPWS